jgi:hypothetical protein
LEMFLEHTFFLVRSLTRDEMKGRRATFFQHRSKAGDLGG